MRNGSRFLNSELKNPIPRHENQLIHKPIKTQVTKYGIRRENTQNRVLITYIPMALLTTAPSPSLWDLARTFLTTILGVSKAGDWWDADMVFLMKNGTLEFKWLLVLVLVVAISSALLLCANAAIALKRINASWCGSVCLWLPWWWRWCVYIYKAGNDFCVNRKIKRGFAVGWVGTLS